MTNNIFKTKEQYLEFRKAFAKAAQAKTLRAEHFIFLNLVRGLPYHRGFTPITSKNKLSNGSDICPGLDRGVQNLRYAIHSSRGTTGADFKNFIAPFIEEGDVKMAAILMQVLQKLENTLDSHEKYYSYFGIGRKVAEFMISSDKTPHNYQEFIEIVEEIKNA